jgi:hypothetical protein
VSDASIKIVPELYVVLFDASKDMNYNPLLEIRDIVTGSVSRSTIFESS